MLLFKGQVWVSTQRSLTAKVVVGIPALRAVMTSMVSAVARSHVDVRGICCIRGSHLVWALLQLGILLVVCADDTRNYVLVLAETVMIEKEDTK